MTLGQFLFLCFVVAPLVSYGVYNASQYPEPPSDYPTNVHFGEGDQ
jgi:hypothetical protein